MTAAAPDVPASSAPLGRKVAVRKMLDALILAAAYAGAAAMVVLLLLLAGVLFLGAWPAMRHFGLHFLVSRDWDPQQLLFGALPAIAGTLVSSFLALLIAVPISIGSAIFLVRIAPGWARGWLVAPASFLIELLAAIPSIAYGLWGIAVLVPFMQRYILPPIIHTLGQLNWWSLGKDEWDNESFFPANLFSGSSSGYGMLTAALILAIMVIPIITAVTRDVLRVVPKELEQGAYGLGATWWQATKVVLSYAKGGIFGAVILGFARAIGETMAVTMVMPPNDSFSASLTGNWSTITNVLANKFREAPRGLYADSLTYMALILLVITVLINLAARWLVSRTRRAR